METLTDVWPKWKRHIKLGDLVRFSDEKRARIAERVEKYPETMVCYGHIFEIGLVIDTNGLDPVVSFPSRNRATVLTNNLEVM